MDRRDILKMIVAATGTAFVGSQAVAYEFANMKDLSGTGFSTKDVALLNELGEVIIPKTDTPGAKEANVGSAIVAIVGDCYKPEERAVFQQGLKQIQLLAQSKYSKEFLLLDADQKKTLLTALDTEAKQYKRKNKANELPHYFTMLKQQVLFCFFTSKKGATQALRFVAIPGRYDGEYPYKKGDKAWAT